MKKLLFIVLTIISITSSCKKDIEGCMDSSAINYNSEATLNDNSCLFDSDGDGIYDSNEILGCTDFQACNFNIIATDSDNDSCEYSEFGYDCYGNNAEFYVGQKFNSGIVFFIDSTGEHGLMAALEDLTEGATDPYGFGFNGYEWGCYEWVVSGANGSSIGTGYQNTIDIVNQGCSTYYGGLTAAQASLDAEINGYSDWYLPSRYELQEMSFTIGPRGPEGNIGGFSNHKYWSSSEYTSEYSLCIRFTENPENPTPHGVSYNLKSYTFRVRVIRAF